VKEIKRFTPVEANRTLPLVKRIVADIQERGQELMRLAGDLGDDASEDPRIKKLIDELNEFMEELGGIGCSYKDPQFKLGLVDFPAVIDGEEVLLCWRSDEPSVAFYHAPEAGYAGRKPIPEPLLA
jgi:hypothetical protein